MVRAGLLIAGPSVTVAHMNMISPPSWTDPAGKYVSSNDWSAAGCGDAPDVPEDVEQKPEGCLPGWYSNNTFIPDDQEPTIPKDSVLRTYKECPFPRDPSKDFVSEENCRLHPWGAPGTAPIQSPCGVDGGNIDGCPAGNPGKDSCAAGGYGHGPDARVLYQDRERFVTEWVAGTEVEVKSAIVANHGGGYSYRLCPKPKNLIDLTEECFQAGSLEFVGNSSWAVWNGDDNDRVEIPAYGISLPTGHWRQNPTPACNDPSGGAATGGATLLGICEKGYQFPPRASKRGAFGINHPMAGFSGSGSIGGALSTSPLKQWAVVDRVKLPESLPSGDYVMSYRSDCEQTSQVWSMCADIKISRSAVSV